MYRILLFTFLNMHSAGKLSFNRLKVFVYSLYIIIIIIIIIIIK